MKQLLYLSFVLILLGLAASCSSTSSVSKEETLKYEEAIQGCGYQLLSKDKTPLQGVKYIITSIVDNHDKRVREGVSDKNGLIRFVDGDPVKGTISIVCPEYESMDLPVDRNFKTFKKVNPEPSKSYSVLCYNVLKGFEKNDHKKAEFIEWQKDYAPDFILFQEMNYFTEESLSAFAKKYGHAHTALVKEKGYPTGFSSKYPIQSIRRVTEGQTHGYLHVQCEDIHFFVCHLSPRTLEARIAEIEAIIRDIKSLGKDAKVVVAGDLNSYNAADAERYGSDFVADRKKFKPTVEVDYTVTNRLLEEGFTDSYVEKHKRFKPTIPVTSDFNPEDRGFRYDYVFVSPRLVNKLRYSDIIRDKITDKLSDHYPVIIRLSR